MSQGKKRQYIVKMTVIIICFLFAVSINSGIITPNTRNLTPRDSTPPTIRIDFAGNRGDKGGPLITPPFEDVYNGSLCPDGYYTNDSYQQENWIYIKLTINGTSSEPGIARLHWCQRIGQTLNWNNNTWSFIRTLSTGKPHEYYYEFNSSGNIIINQEGCFSFDIWANDESGNSALYQWNKITIGGNAIRRFVNLGCIPSDTISYTPLYFFEHNPPYQLEDRHGTDRFHHDQGADGSFYDTGVMNSITPSDIMCSRSCSTFVGFWFDKNVCIRDFSLQNIYYHTWISSRENDSAVYYIGWGKTRGYPTLILIDSMTWFASEAISSIYYNEGLPWISNNYKLAAKLLPISSFSFTDNNIYEAAVTIVNTQEPGCISNRSIPSFVIFNVPDNSTLNTSHADTDLDGLSDWVELYRTYTSPFLADTDNDGVSDYEETAAHSDPNNYTDRNQRPNIPSNPFPNGGYVDVYSNLNWTGGDLDQGDIVTYTVYFKADSFQFTPQDVVSDNQTETIYNPGQHMPGGHMPAMTKYFWKIISWDNHGACREGPIWSFITSLVYELFWNSI